MSKCTACADCTTVCPVIAPSEFDQGLGERKATFKTYAQAIPGAYSIEKKDRPPCNQACPANLNVQGYTAMVKMGKYREAIEIIMRDLPLPGVLGRVCPHPCEKSCRRAEVDQAVSIRELKRIAADRTDLSAIPVPEITPRNKSVAIIGAGPAGLTAGYFLAQQGYKCSIYEAMPEAGGMMRYGIPEHRLPRSVLKNEIDNIKRYGVDIQTNVRVGQDISFAEIKNHSDAVFLSVGAWKGLDLRIPGEDLEGVMDATTFLSEVHLGRLTSLSGKAVIIGGGHSAIDASRVAKRLGAEEVHIIYRRSQKEMLAEEEEVEETIKEGIQVHFLVAPLKVVGADGNVSGIECIRTKLTEPDTTGRRKPIPVHGSEFFIEASYIIPAIGQEPDLSFLSDGGAVEVSPWNFVKINPGCFMTSEEGVFAGGDVVTGPATVIEAVDAGKRAARYIGMYLEGKELPQELEQDRPFGTDWKEIPEDIQTRPRMKVPTLEVEKRLHSFQEVSLAVDDETAQAEAARCLDCGGCCECYECVKACGPHAVTLESHGQQEEILDLDVGSIILAPGFKAFDPSSFETYGYANYPNVVTSLEFERLLSASGPTMGRLTRPSDKKEPEKIAWLQCVGSREINRCDHPYCSGVCCMYAIKEAVIAKEHSKRDLDATIFFMDMRTHGKDFERYYNRAEKEHGVRFVRSRVHSIEKAENGDDLAISYVTESGELKREDYDLVVLSVGLETPPELIETADRLGIGLNEDNFALTTSFSPVATTREGVYVCGAFQGPKDIPQSVMEASAAAASAGAMLSVARDTRTKEAEVIVERSIIGERPRVGVFVCHCGINIAGVVDVAAVKEYAATLPYVEYVDTNLYSCSQDTQDKMAGLIKEKGLNRVVVAACTPRTHEPLFQETLQSASLNKYLFEMANIRNQDSWVHADDPAAATEKAKDLVRMAVSKVALLEPLQENELTIHQDALVIGGGLAGMTAAQVLAEQGYRTHLVERKDELGGQARDLFKTWKGEDVQARLKQIIADVKSNPNIQVHSGAVIKDVGGFVGNFTTALTEGGQDVTVDHGVAIVATGGSEYKPDEYLYGKDDRVLTSLELDRLFIENSPRLSAAKTVSFIQCVGSREPQRPYCSRVCCTHSVESALEFKRRNPGTDVYIFYRDIRTYGERELIYKEAREAGVIFVRYHLDRKPRVSADDSGLSIEFVDHVLGRPLRLETDMLVLASAIIPPRDEQLAQFFKVPMNEDGFLVEAHAKLRPVEFATDGVFLCGLSHYPKPIDEAVAQAQAAASRAITLLAKKKIHVSGEVASVRAGLCSECGVCVSICPYSAPSFDEKSGKASINPVLCKGCGLCVASCRSGAISLKGFDSGQIFAQIEAV